MIQNLLTVYNPVRFATVIAYMLQNTEYQVGPYLRWFWRTQSFHRIMYRRQLDVTKIARLVRLTVYIGMILQLLAGLLLVLLWHKSGVVGGLFFGLAVIISYPVVWAHVIILPLLVGRELVMEPRQQKAIAASAALFAASPAIKIAIAGSYGKTSMKELLTAVLSQGKQVAATPANKNTAGSHAAFARSLSGQEEVLLIEYGEGKPGDILKLAEATHPTHAVITGLAPAHLDQYKTLEAAGKDIFSIVEYVQDKQVYVSNESDSVKAYIKPEFTTYDQSGALGWKVTKPHLSISGVTFELTKAKQKLKLSSGLLGAHQLAPLGFAAAFAMELGLSAAQVSAGIAQTKPFEHRMQPYQLGGAWVIDDTYNGNIEGIRAGTDLLNILPAQRKLYVSPGLVDQGAETENVHLRMGALIAAADPDIVVLMRNSTTQFIQNGLEQAGFTGELRIVTEPLEFYTNLSHFLVAGDLVIMQNDWTDNYS